MSKKRITLTEEDLRTAVKDVVRQFCEDVLTEGIDIDTDNKVISFNGSHQNNVDTNDYIHPHIIQNSVRGETVLSVFERKDNDEGNDGNPLIYALKGIRGWRFNNPRSDIMALLRRFVSVTSNLHIHFDTLIITPSNNELNNLIFSYLRRLVNFENHIESLFRKLTVSEVYEHYYDEEYFDKIAKSEQEAVFMRREMTTAFRKMNTQNNGIFSYKYIKALAYRDAIEQSLAIDFDDEMSMQYRSQINEKNVLVLDDTVASGKTLSDSANAIRAMFSPKSITFLTVFSPKSSQGFENNRIQLT